MRGELREETAVRRLRARLDAQSLKAALSAQTAMLATYGAADRGRRNKDWRASNLSADQAIIPDAATLNARARQMVRDTWVAQSAVGAFARNVIGCGIIPVPQAKSPGGSLNTKLNKQLMLDFWAWASDKHVCDVEQDQTFWQMQALAESERATVGEAFWIWSYEPAQTLGGGIDTARPIGLKLQSFEPEQLDSTIYSHTDAAGVTREVRGGLELDARGVVVAYHVFSRNPNDYTFRQSLQSTRIAAERVLHYYRKRRVRQKRGVSDLAPVLQDMRDLIRGKDANLWRMIMEACIGVTVKRDTSGGFGQGGFATMPRAAGDSGTTGSGMPTVDFVPGMVADPGPGVSLEPYVPQAPGNNYEPFSRQTLRGVAAGAGISYGQVSRDFTQGTYSGQRQEMLEDRKEFEPLQELAAHNLILPVYRLFVALSALEGRIDARGYASDPNRFTAAEYVAPPPTWIDPKAEAEALEKLIKLRVITREEIAQMRGYRLADILDKIAAEEKAARALEISFDENQGAVDPEIERAKGKAEAYGTAVRAGVITPNVEDEKEFREQLKLPQIPEAVAKMWEEIGGVKRPITIAEDDTGGGTADSGVPPQFTNKPKPAAMSAIADAAPNYALAAIDSPQKCGACRFFIDGKCQAYDFAAAADHTCDAWETVPVVDDAGGAGGKRVFQAPGVQDGERRIDDPRGTLLDRGQRGVSGTGN